SSDVCSSDLTGVAPVPLQHRLQRTALTFGKLAYAAHVAFEPARSEVFPQCLNDRCKVGLAPCEHAATEYAQVGEKVNEELRFTAEPGHAEAIFRMNQLLQELFYTVRFHHGSQVYQQPSDGTFILQQVLLCLEGFDSQVCSVSQAFHRFRLTESVPLRPDQFPEISRSACCK